MNPGPRDLWVVGARRAGRARLITSQADIAVDSHHLLRGPYTGLGTVLRALVPSVHRRHPDLVARHRIEILSIAPELIPTVGAPPDTLTTLAAPEERTRYYSPQRTKRLAHGIVELLHAYAERRGAPLTLAFENVHHADPTDQEFLAILLRRSDPGRIRVVVGTAATELPDELAAQLMARAHRLDAGDGDSEARNAEALVRAYVYSDGTSDDPAEHAAYEEAPASLSAALHQARITELAKDAELTTRLGAIPYHLERGTGPAEAVGEAFVWAVDHCMRMGFYHAALDLAVRARKLIDPSVEPRRSSLLGAKAAACYSLLGQADQAERTYLELRSDSTEPDAHIVAYYGLAMLYTRYQSPENKDHNLAKAYVNTAVALASQIADAEERAFHTVFHQNGLALVELHLGDLNVALRLVNEGLARLDRELPENRHRLHRSVLLHNRGQVHAALGNLDAALADYTRVIELDPNHAEYYLDRGNLHRRRDDNAAAGADYESAMALSPPFPEVYYNRADLRAATGDRNGALTDYSYVLELDPHYRDARINRANMWLESGDLDAAAKDVETGLALHPGDADLLATRGLLALENGDSRQARDGFVRALDADPSSFAALANLATLHYEEGDLDGSIELLSRALELAGDHPDLLYNRGRAYARSGRLLDAIADYTRALESPHADRSDLLYQRALCRAAVGQEQLAREDLQRHLAYGPSPHAEEIASQLDALTRT